MKTQGFFIALLLLPLFKTAGQQAEMIKDINPGTGSSYIIYMTLLEDRVIFAATNSGNFNDEPWVTDGTEAGTMMLKEINPNPDMGSSIGPMIVYNNEVYFQANDFIHGPELWKTNGTPEGTRMVVDLFPGSQGCHPGELTVFQNKLFFSAYTPGYGYELWKTQGDSATTVLVADIVPGTESASPCYLFAADSCIYFGRSNANGVYRSDGTSAGTGLLFQNVIIGQLGNACFTEYDSAVYFRGTDIIGPDAKGTQLWRISGNDVRRVTSIVSPEATLNPDLLTVAGDKLYFTGEQYPYGNELWKYDSNGAQMVKDINPSGHGNLGGFLIEYKGKLIFSAGVSDTGVELWVSDGTEDGTKLISDIYPGPISSGVVSPVKIGDTLYFSAHDETDGEIWRLLSPDGQPSKFTDIPDGGAWGPEFVRLGGIFIFYAGNGTSGTELWKMNAPVVGINNPDQKVHGIVVFPNPVKDFIDIEIPDNIKFPAELNIFNSSGCKTWSQVVNSRSVILNRESLICYPGICLLRINDGLRSSATKFVVSK